MRNDEKTVDKLPACFFCTATKKKKQQPARYDGRTREGPWRKMCPPHFVEHGIGIGLGIGLRLWLKGERHAPGEHPRRELPPLMTAEPQEDCEICGSPWFSRVLERINGKIYCPPCLRTCFPVRDQGPFTFSDTIVAEYLRGESEGEYLGRVFAIPEINVIEVRFEAEDSDPETTRLALDGYSQWWDVDNELGPDSKGPLIEVRRATAKEVIEYDTIYFNRVRDSIGKFMEV